MFVVNSPLNYAIKAWIKKNKQKNPVKTTVSSTVKVLQFVPLWELFHVSPCFEKIIQVEPL